MDLEMGLQSCSLMEARRAHDEHHEKVIKHVGSVIKDIIGYYHWFINTTSDYRNEGYIDPLINGHVIHQGMLSFLRSFIKPPLVELHIPTNHSGQQDVRGIPTISVYGDDDLDLAERLQEGLRPVVGDEIRVIKGSYIW